MNSWQSSQETCSTGRFFSPLKLLGLLPITACHCSCVTRCTPMKNPRLKVTLCWVSFSCLSFSSFGLPIKNVPGGIQANFIPRLLVTSGGRPQPGEPMKLVLHPVHWSITPRCSELRVNCFLH